MKKYLPLCLLVSLISLTALWHFSLKSAPVAEKSVPAVQYEKNILLIPLDGRPPCRQFVIDAAAIAGVNVQTPPTELQDYYSAPGDTAGMRSWIRENLAANQAAIISIDQLLYGGLLAAREQEAPEDKQQALINYLRELHQKYPDIPLLAFSILPRQTPQDTIDGYQERKDLLAYSRLKGRQAMGLSVDETELARLQSTIPAASLQKYLAHFAENTALNQKLIALVQEGVLSRLVLGQDDGEPYSIPNIEKEKIRQLLADKNISPDKVCLTHGADEIALTMLAAYTNNLAGWQPRIYTAYNHPRTPEKIMPYMAISMADTAREKIQLIGGQSVSSPDTADFILYLSANDYEQDTVSSRSQACQYISAQLQAHRQLALVDLSKHFTAQETILPLLLESDIPLNALTAYAGWNTASNSIGTVAASASLYCAAIRQAATVDAAAAATQANIKFLHNRMLEDYFYLKADIDMVNHSLQKAGYHNTADLDLEHNWRWANNMLQTSMQKHLAAYKYAPAIRTPAVFSSPAGQFTLTLYDLKAELSYPWPRTFEIYLESTPYLTTTVP
ncbi:MAG: DUF4127 family protein [Selenomonas sp.]|nr:DUF4127 family protein [Selenomonas sp.]MBQ2087103.1 DUF4127 family protein [Selenomonas sp.]MBQ4211788.1 DUF4127 family protein [Selenomonas sp.]